jgi:hypothetical protein
MYEQNKDLILVSFFGFIYYAIVIGLNGHLTRIPLGEYFLVPFALAVLMGMAIGRPSQMLEWPLCFLFGGVTGSFSIVLILSFLGMSFSLQEVLFTLSQTFAWFGVVSAMILVGMLLGAFLKASYNLVLGSLQIPLQ